MLTGKNAAIRRSTGTKNKEHQSQERKNDLDVLAVDLICDDEQF